LQPGIDGRGQLEWRLQARLDKTGRLRKSNPGDLDDRSLWPKFIEAYSDVFPRPGTDAGPRHVNPADRQWYRCLVVADILIKSLKGLGMQYPGVEFDPKDIRID